MNYSTIPHGMKCLRNWILYRLEDQGREKPAKVPYAINGARAKTNDPGTWTTFDEALTAFQRGGYAGLGFVLTGTQFIGIDIDGCVDPDTGEITPEAQEAVRTLNSYTELSQSGKGLHIIVEGKLPDGRRRNGAFEMYGKDSPRYFAMTGDVWGELSDIRVDQAAINEVHRNYIQPSEMKQTEASTGAHDVLTDYDADDQLIAKARRADADFDALFRGNWLGRYESQSQADLALCNKLAFWARCDASLIDQIFRKSGLIRPKWDEVHGPDTYGGLTITKAIDGCRRVYDPQAYSQKRTAKIANVRGQAHKCLVDLHPERNERFSWTDIGNGNLFADFFKDRARYVPERAMWFLYNGMVWRPDVGGLMVMQLCKQLADDLMVYALSIEDERQRRAYIDHVNRWQKRSYRDIILKDAASVHPIQFAAFDNDPMLFNCQNGTLNLDNGQFFPHRPEDFLSKLSSVNYNPDARCDRWEQFIDEVMQGDVAKARFLQKALGYALTGLTKEECFFILYGAKSRNGKGTCMETYARLMGDYGKSAKPDTIAQKQAANGSGPSEDIARLVGARFVNISEPDKRLVLSAALVKTLTGRDTITARFLHENSIEFRPDFKLFINCNYLPAVTDVTLFSSGRVNVIPFERHFKDGEQDKDLKDELARPENLSGILNWCMEGLRAFMDEGLVPPDSVLAATKEYRHQSDKIGRFVSEELEANPQAEVRTADVYARFQTWCCKNGFRAESAQNFNAQLKNFGEVKPRRPAGSARTASPVSLLFGYCLLPRAYENFVPTYEGSGGTA